MQRGDKRLMEKAQNIYSVRARARADDTTLGLRERHKIDKLERISNAAQFLFSCNGYDGTTLRDIAKEAGVALGTLTLYAEDKRDLTVLLFNKLIPPLLEVGRANAMKPGVLAETMVAFFEPFYRAYANNAVLYRIILGQVFSPPTSIHAQENARIRVTLVSSLTDIILRARSYGECSSKGNLDIQARSFFYLYFASVRLWLSEVDPKPERGIEDLREMFVLHIEGMKDR
jgi:AcrR family transcriptional regulator